MTEPDVDNLNTPSPNTYLNAFAQPSLPPPPRAATATRKIDANKFQVRTNHQKKHYNSHVQKDKIQVILKRIFPLVIFSCNQSSPPSLMSWQQGKQPVAGILKTSRRTLLPPECQKRVVFKPLTPIRDYASGDSSSEACALEVGHRQYFLKI